MRLLLRRTSQIGDPFSRSDTRVNRGAEKWRRNMFYCYQMMIPHELMINEIKT